MGVIVSHGAAFEMFQAKATKIRALKPAVKPELFRDQAVGLADIEEKFMSSTTDKVKGTANEAMGKAKQGIGEATGSDKMKGEGAVQEVKGKGQKAMGDAKDAAKEAVDRAAGAAKRSAD
jgi:uncharacterized protein YjbJ (UPF0337 family)